LVGRLKKNKNVLKKEREREREREAPLSVGPSLLEASKDPPPQHRSGNYKVLLAGLAGWLIHGGSNQP